MFWYALFVETGSEDTVKRYLQLAQNDLELLIPSRKVPEKKINGKRQMVLKRLFSGYILVHTTLDGAKYSRMRRIPKLIKVLGHDLTCSPIEMNEIAVLLKLMNPEGIIDYSKVYLENSRIVISDGPLKGYEGIVKKINLHTQRAKIALDFLGEQRLIDLGIELISQDGCLRK